MACVQLRSQTRFRRALLQVSMVETCSGEDPLHTRRRSRGRKPLSDHPCQIRSPRTEVLPPLEDIRDLRPLGCGQIDLQFVLVIVPPGVGIFAVLEEVTTFVSATLPLRLRSWFPVGLRFSLLPLIHQSPDSTFLGQTISHSLRVAPL